MRGRCCAGLSAFGKPLRRDAFLTERERSVPFCETNPNCMTYQTGFNHLDYNYLQLETCEGGFGFVFWKLRFSGKRRQKGNRASCPTILEGRTATGRDACATGVGRTYFAKTTKPTACGVATKIRRFTEAPLQRSHCNCPRYLPHWHFGGDVVSFTVPMKIKGVIFDMDGTITAPYFDFNKIRDEAGIGDIDMLDYLGTASGLEHARVTAVLKKFEDAGVDGAELNAGARELLDELARRGMPTALLTRNTRRSVDGVCRKLNLKFEITVTREDGPHKPAPEPIWEIARRWGAEAGGGIDGGGLQMGRALREERGRAQRDADERRAGAGLGKGRDVYH